VTRAVDSFSIFYQRHTLRYPLEFYDDGEEPPVVRLDVLPCTREPDTFTGPIMVYPRKRFTPAEVGAIWRATKSRCHLCGHRWRLDKRGRDGCHIDHVIPHIGGGADVEELPNHRIACAKCNLKKGRGYTEKQVRLGFHRLIEAWCSWPGT